MILFQCFIWTFSKWKYFIYVENVMINLRFWSVLTETDIFLKRDEISREGTNTYLWINVSHFWIGEMRAFDVNCQNISSPCNLKIYPFVNAFTQFSKRKLNSYILDIFCAMKENIFYIWKNYHHFSLEIIDLQCIAAFFYSICTRSNHICRN